MEIISMDSRLFESLVTNLKSIVNEVEAICNGDNFKLTTWLDNQDVCNILNISKRTLQTYRDNGTLPYSQLDRKIYYKPDDVEKVLLKKSQKRRNGNE